MATTSETKERRRNMKRLRKTIIALSAVLFVVSPLTVQAENITLLNVSYDPTRELYQEFNTAFVKYWQKEKGQSIVVKQSHAGSSKQARAVIDGLDADVVTLALAYDVDAIAKARMLPANWQLRLPHNSSPYTSTIVFLVRKGNPKAIRDWDDLVKPGTAIIPANPKTSGAARWGYLSAWGYALKQYGNDEAKAKEFIGKFYANVPVLDSGARGATTTFVERGIGDVLVGWENEAYLALKEFGSGKFQIVTPSVSILAEPTVSLVDKVVKRKGTEVVAQAYLRYLYSDEGQDIAARNFYRPRSEAASAKYSHQFARLNLFTIDETFGGWQKAQQIHFADGGVFDEIYKPNR